MDAENHDFISNLAHELRTPLTSLKLQIELTKRTLMKKGLEGLSNEQLAIAIQNFDKKTDQIILLLEKYIKAPDDHSQPL